MINQEINKQIRDGWIAGLITIGVTLALTLIYASGAGIAHIDSWNWIDIILLSALTYGIYRKSRASAVLMLVYYLGSKIVLWTAESAFIGVPLALVFAYFFWRSVQGTFAYHATLDEEEPIGLPQA